MSNSHAHASALTALLINGQNFVFGTPGDDKLVGTTDGPDVLIAGPGNDTLIANDPSDQLYGGPGHDVFIVYSLSQAVDYNSHTDVIAIIEPPPPANYLI